ncbi:hypothetical protein D043_3418, partial [Vibrio parahaemolyticus EKP-021]
MGLLQITAIG